MAKKRTLKKHKKSVWRQTVNPFLAWSLIGIVALFGLFTLKTSPDAQTWGDVEGANTGFDEFGYNRTARIFSGKADGVDKIIDGKVWGDPTYANDLLVMKWNPEWDRGVSENWADPNGYAAWEDNQWNGMAKNGSKTNWHYKIVWDSGCKENGNSSAGGTSYCIWGQFAVLMDQGVDANAGPVHIFAARGTPTATARIDSSLKRVFYWWIYDALHVSYHETLSHLLLIEYGFHVTMMAAAIYLVFLVSKTFRKV